MPKQFAKNTNDTHITTTTYELQASHLRLVDNDAAESIIYVNALSKLLPRTVM